MNIEKDFFQTEFDTCSKCGGEIYESETLSRCLRCGKSTPWEMSGKEYYKVKNKNNEEND
ncbi:hypothetical protein F4V43_02105 [Paenibacillus spiritus]|uniref:Uncharacterized protein n=1 Tax=Paenibacillus spiritus TaxID=2496557 RepID=A0A5J5GHW7_9BACL|nr:hypothetical protein [Paenibacillus spiritus]KAA9007302.1 hypothetical protein F4V43_02105 [Paenibacillus spiritus]